MEKEQIRPDTSPKQNLSDTKERVGVFSILKAREIWGKEFNGLAELFCTTTVFSDKKIVAETHLMGMNAQNLTLVQYDDSRGYAQISIAKHIAPGEIAISIKHHSPSPLEEIPEQIKLQCSHIQIAVGVDGGVITVNNPQSYEQGLFGDENYPMIFVKPKFPKSLTEAQIKAYLDNIRTWLVIANTFTQFPSDYNGGDPLICRDKTTIIKMGKALIGALNGDVDAVEWLRQPDQHVYCAELALLALNLGLYFPLNKIYLENSFEQTRDKLKSKDFLDENGNTYIKLVQITSAPDQMLSFDEIMPVMPDSEKFWNGMALTPFCVADMIEYYIQNIVPRQKLGEIEGSKYQAMIFQKLRPSLKDFLKIDNEEAACEFEKSLDVVREIVSRPHQSYQEFREAIFPILNGLTKFSFKYGQAYIPPHCFLIRATEAIEGRSKGGALDWEYVAHGLHANLFTEGVIND